MQRSSVIQLLQRSHTSSVAVRAHLERVAREGWPREAAPQVSQLPVCAAVGIYCSLGTSIAAASIAVAAVAATTVTSIFAITATATIAAATKIATVTVATGASAVRRAVQTMLPLLPLLLQKMLPLLPLLLKAQQCARCDAQGAQTVQNGPFQAHCIGDVRVAVQRVVVTAQSVQHQWSHRQRNREQAVSRQRA